MMKNIISISLQNNNLEGYFPQSWADFFPRSLDVSGNANLEGCYPVYGATVQASGTKLTGPCKYIPGVNDVDVQKQRAAIIRFLVSTFTPLGMDDPLLSGSVQMIQQMADDLRGQLGRSIQPGQGSKWFLTTHPQGEQRGTCRVRVQLIDGVEYITEIIVEAWQPYVPAGLNVTVLPSLAEGLPNLRRFVCVFCSQNSTDFTNSLPAGLPLAAPKLSTLALVEARNVFGTLPVAWSTWSSLQVLDLPFNQISGSLPSAWSNLANLQELRLAYNDLSGTLPPEWGAGAMQPRLLLDLSANKKVTGTIPESWSRFSEGFIDLRETNITGCTGSERFPPFECTS